ncbi:hypothetical protein QBC40DRAFT_106408 [Triangularia verruculosa]|uniref:Uncharacterized protein n=1 Tax=Triangularia verruculosa TaxID=2587418 RepID=A0AAN7AST5_9PEZI|nr:hypothetical protein QBC40DRAFT_106408 [Triangularia verruculosa]
MRRRRSSRKRYNAGVEGPQSNFWRFIHTHQRIDYSNALLASRLSLRSCALSLLCTRITPTLLATSPDSPRHLLDSHLVEEGPLDSDIRPTNSWVLAPTEGAEARTRLRGGRAPKKSKKANKKAHKKEKEKAERRAMREADKKVFLAEEAESQASAPRGSSLAPTTAVAGPSRMQTVSSTSHVATGPTLRAPSHPASTSNSRAPSTSRAPSSSSRTATPANPAARREASLEWANAQHGAAAAATAANTNVEINPGVNLAVDLREELEDALAEAMGDKLPDLPPPGPLREPPVRERCQATWERMNWGSFWK